MSIVAIESDSEKEIRILAQRKARSEKLGNAIDVFNVHNEKNLAAIAHSDLECQEKYETFIAFLRLFEADVTAVYDEIYDYKDKR